VSQPWHLARLERATILQDLPHLLQVREPSRDFRIQCAGTNYIAVKKSLPSRSSAESRDAVPRAVSTAMFARRLSPVMARLIARRQLGRSERMAATSREQSWDRLECVQPQSHSTVTRAAKTNQTSNARRSSAPPIRAGNSSGRPEGAESEQASGSRFVANRPTHAEVSVRSTDPRQCHQMPRKLTRTADRSYSGTGRLVLATAEERQRFSLWGRAR
jgi:hypothetical protein